MSALLVAILTGSVWLIACVIVGVRSRRYTFSRRIRLKISSAIAQGAALAIGADLSFAAWTGFAEEHLLPTIVLCSLVSVGLVLELTTSLWWERRLLPKTRTREDSRRSALCITAIGNGYIGKGPFVNGFFVRPDLVVTILTASELGGKRGVHTIRGPFHYEVLASNITYNLALLRVDEYRSPHSVLPLAYSSDGLVLNEAVLRLGYTRDCNAKVEWGGETGLVVWQGPLCLIGEWDAPSDDSRWQHGYPVSIATVENQPGERGCPILIEGEVVGIVNISLDGKIVIVPIEAVHDLFDEVGVDF